MSRKTRPMKVPNTFGEAAAASLADEPTARLSSDTIPFMDLPMSATVTLYEPPGAMMAHVTEPDRSGDTDHGGVWFLFPDEFVDTLTTAITDGDTDVEFVREGTRFRDELADSYYVPGEDDE